MIGARPVDSREASTPVHRTAGLLRRLASVFVDTLPAALLVWAGFGAGLFDARIFSAPDGWFWTEWLFKYWLDERASLTAPLAALVATAIAWTTACELIFGRSLGARLFSLVVVDRSAFTIGRRHALLRALGSALNVATLGLGYLWVFVSRYRRGLHDLLSGTVVVIDETDK